MRARPLLAFLIALVVPTSAAAQDDEPFEDEELPESELAPPPVPEAESVIATATPLRLPVPVAARPLTLPKGVARISGSYALSSASTAASGRQEFVSFSGRVSAGLLDDLEAGATLLPLSVSPQARYEDPGLYLRGRVLQLEGFELGLALEGVLPVRDTAAVAPAVFGLVRAGEEVRFDFAAALRVQWIDDPTTADDEDPFVVLSFPIGLTVQTSKHFFVGATTGFDVERFETGYIPGGLFLGGTLEVEEGARGDLRADLVLPSLTDGFHSWSIVVSASSHFFL